MSFALEYRRKMQGESMRTNAKQASRDAANEGFAVRPAERQNNTRANRRHMLATLSLAGIILSVFNSGSFVNYTRNLAEVGLAESEVGTRIIEGAESWHELMAEHRVTTVVKGIRDVVMKARDSSWQDLAFSDLSQEPLKTHPVLNMPAPLDEEPPARELDLPLDLPVAPILKASIRDTE